MYRECSIYVSCMQCIYQVRIMYNVCTVCIMFVVYMYCRPYVSCMQCMWCMYHVCTVCIMYVLYVSSLYIMFTVCTEHVDTWMDESPHLWRHYLPALDLVSTAQPASCCIVTPVCVIKLSSRRFTEKTTEKTSTHHSPGQITHYLGPPPPSCASLQGNI